MWRGVHEYKCELETFWSSPRRAAHCGWFVAIVFCAMVADLLSYDSAVAWAGTGVVNGRLHGDRWEGGGREGEATERHEEEAKGVKGGDSR